MEKQNNIFTRVALLALAALCAALLSLCLGAAPLSLKELDVYKRQVLHVCPGRH